MTALLFMLTFAAAQAPVVIRVLESEKPARLTLTAKRIQCDETNAASQVVLEGGARAVRLGSSSCAVVTAQGPSTVTVGTTTRRYAGTVRIVIENGLLKVLNEPSLEEYVSSVVGAESTQSAAAALEAHAIVVRTFAKAAHRRHGAAGYDLCDVSHCQVYQGEDQQTPEANQAAAKTAGQVLLVGGITLKPAFFHAACGGHTSRAIDVFREEAAGPGVSDVEPAGPLCRDLPDFTWEWTIDRPTLASALGLKPDGVAFEPLRRDTGGRVLELKSFGKRFSGNDFFAKVRRAFGAQTLRGLNVSAQEIESVLHFTGTGAGHGVGLCQQGAKTLAERGADAKTILQRYFSDSQVRVF